MFGGILEVVIGVAFVYLLLSLIVSAVSEFIASIFNLRAKNLKTAIEQLLPGMATDFYDHSLIKNLSKPSMFGGLAKPAYIPRETFAAILLEKVKKEAASVKAVGECVKQTSNEITGGDTPAQAQAKLARLIDRIRLCEQHQPECQAVIDKIDDQSQADVKQAIQDLLTKMGTPATFPQLATELGNLPVMQAPVPADWRSPTSNQLRSILVWPSYASAGVKLVRQDLQAMLAAGSQPNALGYKTALAKLAGQLLNELGLRYAIQQIDNDRVRKSLETLLNDASGQITRFKSAIESWFDTTMQESIGWYKQRALQITVCLALIITVATNVDTVVLVQQLAVRPALRQSLAAQAEKFAEQPPLVIQAGAVAAADPAGAVDESDSNNPPKANQTTVPTKVAQFTLKPARIVGGRRTTLTIDPAASARKITLTSNAPGDVMFPLVKTATKKTESSATKPEPQTTETGSRSEFTATLTDKPLRVQIDTRSLAATITAELTATVTDDQGEQTTASINLVIEESPQGKTRVLNESLNELDLPIGWLQEIPEGETDELRRELPGFSSVAAFFGDLWKLFTFHVVGWVMTIVAVSLGAPFWFDILNKFVQLRSAARLSTEQEEQQAAAIRKR